MYCTDTDLLRWEPTLFAEAAFASQTLLSADCTLLGTTLTLSGGASFEASRVRAGHVATITSSAAIGCYPIISIDAATAGTISILHEGLNASPPLTAPVTGEAIATHVVVRTFSPQRQIVSELLTWMSGIRPGTAARVMNADVLRRPCALGTLHMIYNAMAAAATGDSADLIVRAELYERLYRRSLRSVVVELDLDGDGRADSQRALRLVQFARV